jgi:ribonuclease-3
MDESRIEGIIGYTFKNKDLIKTAFTHSSKKDGNSNERLEFFGDSILGFLVAETIYFKHPNYDEGLLTKLKALVVKKQTLAEVTNSLGLQNFIELGKGEIKQGIKENTSIKGNLFEAVLGAIYVDGGLNEARKFVVNTLSEIIEKLETEPEFFTDFKSKINEYAGKHGKEYRFENAELPAENNKPKFSVTLFIEGKVEGVGEGCKISEAEQIAAEKAYKKIKNK